MKRYSIIFKLIAAVAAAGVLSLALVAAGKAVAEPDANFPSFSLYDIFTAKTYADSRALERQAISVGTLAYTYGQFGSEANILAGNTVSPEQEEVRAERINLHLDLYRRSKRDLEQFFVKPDGFCEVVDDQVDGTKVHGKLSLL